ncbi:unnamed protein product [Musa acuminata subsp. burmannicoides]
MSSRHTAHSWPATAPPSAAPPRRSSSAVDNPFPPFSPSPFCSIDDHRMHMYTMNTTPIPKHIRNIATNRNNSAIISILSLSLSLSQRHTHREKRLKKVETGKRRRMVRLTGTEEAGEIARPGSTDGWLRDGTSPEEEEEKVEEREV